MPFCNVAIDRTNKHFLFLLLDVRYSAEILFVAYIKGVFSICQIQNIQNQFMITNVPQLITNVLDVVTWATDNELGVAMFKTPRLLPY